jgi:hypothetical protein
LVQQGLITTDTIIENEQEKSTKAGTIKGLEFPSRAIPVPPVYSGSPDALPSSQSQNSSAEGTLFGMEPNIYFMEGSKNLFFDRIYRIYMIKNQIKSSKSCVSCQKIIFIKGF